MGSWFQEDEEEIRTAVRIYCPTLEVFMAWSRILSKIFSRLLLVIHPFQHAHPLNLSACFALMEAELLMTSVCMRRRLRIVEINSSLLPPHVHSILHGAKRDCARMLICLSLLRKTQNYRVAFIMPVKSQKAHHFHLMPSLTVSVWHCF